MNTKKFSVLVVSILLAGASAFAWSKKSENTGNLGRMYLSIEGGMNTSKAKISGQDGSSSPTGAAAGFTMNAPVFKPNINAFRDISWLGMDAQAFFNYNYSNNYEFNDNEYSNTTYGVGVALVPYLNFETGLSFLKAIKPYGKGFCGYMWEDQDLDEATGSKISDNSNYFFYGVGAGVEFVLLDELSVTPFWQWNGNAESGVPVYQTAGVEISYWVSELFCVSAFWTHNFGSDRTYEDGTRLSIKHGDIIGAKFKLGFTR